MLVLNNLGSSNIEQIRYDDDNKTLFVYFHSGGAYAYYGVPQEVFQVLIDSESVGIAFHKLIRNGGYEYEKVGDNIDSMNV